MRAVGVIDREILAAPGDQSEVEVVVQPTAGGVRQVRAADSSLNYGRTAKGISRDLLFWAPGGGEQLRENRIGTAPLTAAHRVLDVRRAVVGTRLHHKVHRRTHRQQIFHELRTFCYICTLVYAWETLESFKKYK